MPILYYAILYYSSVQEHSKKKTGCTPVLALITKFTKLVETKTRVHLLLHYDSLELRPDALIPKYTTLNKSMYFGTQYSHVWWKAQPVCHDLAGISPVLPGKTFIWPKESISESINAIKTRETWVHTRQVCPDILSGMVKLLKITPVHKNSGEIWR